MYSKANSEAEYMDTGTLWDRVNDAVDTIIRKDESAETGEFLPPCVEAALNLGCVPVRASRSQRHSNPRTYLSPRTQESGSAASKFVCGNPNDRNTNLLPPQFGTQLNLENSGARCLVPESNGQTGPNLHNPAAPSFRRLKFPVGEQLNWKESNASFNVGSVYPLYYGTNFQPEISQLGFQEPHLSKDIIIGTPVFATVEKPSEIGCIRSLLSADRNETVADRTKQPEFAEGVTESCEGECDLSLRLGLFSKTVFCATKGSANDSFGRGNSQEEGKIKAISSSAEKNFPFFSASDPSVLGLGRFNNMATEDQNSDAFLRKRKLPNHGNVDIRQRLWPVNSAPHYVYDQRKRRSS
ncbi:OLC1v1038000C2 [Oldenlandia corymbosa var. corymbosa]|nr:OLC1v1038000C2 [Oldenlandia corymbosa var. corymbosa]